MEVEIDVSAADEDGNTPLHMAAIGSTYEQNIAAVAKLLVENGADPNAVDEKGRIPLHWAADKELAKLLIQSGADVNKADESGNTPLHMAAMTNHLKVAKLLIENGAHLNVTCAAGRTPLYRAAGGSWHYTGPTIYGYHASYGSKEMTQLLIAVGWGRPKYCCCFRWKDTIAWCCRGRPLRSTSNPNWMRS